MCKNEELTEIASGEVELEKFVARVNFIDFR